MMGLSLDEFLVSNPVDREKVDAYKQQMLSEVRAYKLREMRENLGLTQQQVAAKLGVSQRQVSKIENGDLDNTKIGTIRKYLDAVGSTLLIEAVCGESHLQVA